MTQEDIIAMAKKVGFERLGVYAQFGGDWVAFTEELEAFGKLVAIHVSRELAKECAGMGEWNAVHIIEGVRW